MPIPQKQTVQRTFIRDDVYHSLKNWIINGILEPGEKLKDKELAAQLGVSRTPVREGLQKLEDEGLVETSPNRWTRVTPISLEDIEHIYPILLSLETLALKIAFSNLNDAHVKKMRALNHEFKRLLAMGDPQAVVEVDTEFHNVFITAAGNTELENILRNLKSKYKRIELAFFTMAPIFQTSYDEHEQLVDAIENNDLALALKALTQNWEASAARFATL